METPTHGWPLGKAAFFTWFFMVIYSLTRTKVVLASKAGRGMEDETQDPRFASEERDGHRIKYFAGQTGKYVGVTKKTCTRVVHALPSTRATAGDSMLWVHLDPRLLLQSP